MGFCFLRTAFRVSIAGKFCANSKSSALLPCWNGSSLPRRSSSSPSSSTLASLASAGVAKRSASSPNAALSRSRKDCSFVELAPVGPEGMTVSGVRVRGSLLRTRNGIGLSKEQKRLVLSHLRRNLRWMGSAVLP